MDFAWTAEQEELRRKIFEFATRELNEGLAEREAGSEFNREGWDQCALVGIQGLPVPVKYGGRGADPLTIAGALESVGYGCLDNGLTFGINAHMWTVEVPLIAFGTDEQKARFLPQLSGGEWIGANAVSEPDAGSDAFAISTRAERKGDRYALN